MVSLPSGGVSVERFAGLHAERLEDLRRGAEAGEPGLQHVGADEGGQPEPGGTDPEAEGEACQHHDSGEGKNSIVDLHFNSPCYSAGSLSLRMFSVSSRKRS